MLFKCSFDIHVSEKLYKKSVILFKMIKNMFKHAYGQSDRKNHSCEHVTFIQSMHL